MRTLGLACNAVDLAFAQKYLCASGDGTSDSKQKRGNVEYFAHIHEIVDFAGDEKAVAIDGFLESFGMTAKEEADTCFMAIEMLKWLLLFAIELFAKLYTVKSTVVLFTSDIRDSISVFVSFLT